MSLATDLIGLGFNPSAADLEGFTQQTLTTTGTSATTAAAIRGSAVSLTTAGSQTGAILPSTWPLWKPIIVTATTATTAIVYPHSGAQLNGGTATTGGQNLAQNKTTMFIRTGDLLWVSILTA